MINKDLVRKVYGLLKRISGHHKGKLKIFYEPPFIFVSNKKNYGQRLSFFITCKEHFVTVELYGHDKHNCYSMDERVFNYDELERLSEFVFEMLIKPKKDNDEQQP